MLTIPGEVGTAYIRVRPNTANFQGEASSSLKRSLIGIGTAVGGFFAAQQALGFVKQSVQTASSIQKSQETIQATMGKSSRAVEEFGRTSASSFLISKKDAESFSARVGLMGQNIGLTGRQSANMSVELLKLAGSFGQVKGEDPTPYLLKLSSALLGNTRGLKQMGIAINSTNELQAAQRLGFIKTTVDAQAVAAARAKVAEYTAKASEEEKKYGATNSHTLGATAELKSAQDALNKALAGSSTSTVASLTAAQKAQVVMAVATSHLSSLQKEASAHSGDLANQTLRLTAEWSNAKDEVGLALLPVVTKLATAFATDLPGAMHGFATAFRTAVETATPIVMPLVGAVKTLSVFLAENRQIVLDLVGAFVAYKVAMFAVNEAQKIARDVQAAYNAVMAAGQGIVATEVTSTEAATVASTELTAALEANTAALSGLYAGNATATASVTALVAAFSGASAETVAAAQAEAVYTGSVERAGAAVGLLSGANLELGTSYAVLSAAVADATAAQTGYAAAVAVTETESVAGAGALGTFARGLVAMAPGGAMGVAIAATAGLTFGLIQLTSGFNPVQSAVDRAAGAFDRLAGSMTRARSYRESLNRALSQIPENKMAVAEAKLAVQTAEANLHNKNLNKTVLERKGNELALKGALLQLHDAQKQLNASEKTATSSEKGLNDQNKRRAHIIQSELLPKLRDLIGEDLHHNTIQADYALGIGRGSDAALRAKAAQAAASGTAKQWAAQLDELKGRYAKNNPLLAHNIGLIEALTKRIHKVPPGKEINFILKLKNPKTTITDVIERFAHGTAKKTGEDVSHAFGDGMVKGLNDRIPLLKTSGENTVNQMLKAVKAQGGISSPSTVFENQVGQPIMDGIIKGINDRQDNLQNQIQKTLQAQMKSATVEAKSLGTSILQGILQPLGSLAGRLQSSIVNAANAAITGAKHALGIKSPSMLFANQVGKPIADGILHGMGGLKAGLVKQIKSAAQSALAASRGFAGGGPSGTAATGANQAIGRQMMLAQGWGADQWGSLQALWNQESGWNQFARNPSSGAFGIPQELGHSVSAAYMAGDVRAQIAWGLDYIRCVPLDSEILTRDGWKRHDEVQIGDETLGYDTDMGTSRWTRILAVHHYQDAPLAALENGRWRAIATPNHRWLAEKVIQPGDGSSWRREEVVEGQNVGTRHRLRLAAVADTGGTLPITVDEAEILGWLLGDGCVSYGLNNRGGKRGKLNVVISQIKPRWLMELDQLMAMVPCSHYVYKRMAVGGGDQVVHHWRLRSGYARDLLDRSGYERSLEGMVLALDRDQRQAFLRGIQRADGYQDHRGGSPMIAQNAGPKLDAIMLTSYLEGHYVNPTDSGGQVHVTLGKPFVKPSRLVDAGRAPVWCVTTDLGSWTLRQGGRTMLTGNSRYGSPAAAWAHEVANNWYGDGGIVKGPYMGAPVVIGAHAGETILPTHKQNSNVASAGVNIENLTVVSSSPHLWGQASDVMNAVSRKVRR